jgi:hypothetical protein
LTREERIEGRDERKRMTWGVRGGSETAALPIRPFQAGFRGGRQQGIER